MTKQFYTHGEVVAIMTTAIQEVVNQAKIQPHSVSATQLLEDLAIKLHEGLLSELKSSGAVLSTKHLGPETNPQSESQNQQPPDEDHRLDLNHLCNSEHLKTWMSKNHDKLRELPDREFKVLIAEDDSRHLRLTMLPINLCRRVKLDLILKDGRVISIPFDRANSMIPSRLRRRLIEMLSFECFLIDRDGTVDPEWVKYLHVDLLGEDPTRVVYGRLPTSPL